MVFREILLQVAVGIAAFASLGQWLIGTRTPVAYVFPALLAAAMALLIGPSGYALGILTFSAVLKVVFRRTDVIGRWSSSAFRRSSWNSAKDQSRNDYQASR